jgi:hypothetical protein
MTTALLPPIPLYLSYAANEAKDASKSASTDYQAQALLTHFQTAAASLTSPAALVADYKSLQVVLGSFGLGSIIGQTAVVKALLTQDPSSKTSLAQKSGNVKYLEFAKALSNWSTPPFASASGVAAVVNAYKINRFEATAETQAPGLQKALYFTRNIGSVTTVNQLQADPDLLAVAVSGLGLPLTNFQLLPFTQQQQILKSKVNFANFSNPAYIVRTAEQYLVSQQEQAATASTAPASGSLLSLFGGADTSGNSVLSLVSPVSGSTSSLFGTSSNAANLLSLFA